MSPRLVVFLKMNPNSAFIGIIMLLLPYIHEGGPAWVRQTVCAHAGCVGKQKAKAKQKKKALRLQRVTRPLTYGMMWPQAPQKDNWNQAVAPAGLGYYRIRI
jgi:hypothetical protein